MPTSSTTIIADLGARLRDPTNFAYPSVQLTRFIDQCQRVLNYQQELVLTTQSFSTVAFRTLYQNSEIASNIARVLMVRQDKRNLQEVDWHSLVHSDSQWFRRIGQRIDLFARLGNDLIIFYPAVQTPVSLDVVYTKVTDALTGAPGDINIPDEYVPILRDMVESLALLKGRRLAEAVSLMPKVPQEIADQGSESVETQGPR